MASGPRQLVFLSARVVQFLSLPCVYSTRTHRVTCQRRRQKQEQTTTNKNRRTNKTKQNKTKQNKTKQNKTKQNKTKQNKTKQNKTKQNKTKQNKTKQNKTKQNKTKQNKTKQNKTKQNKTKQNNKQNNKQTNKPTNQQTNKPTTTTTGVYPKSSLVFCGTFHDGQPMSAAQRPWPRSRTTAHSARRRPGPGRRYELNHRAKFRKNFPPSRSSSACTTKSPAGGGLPAWQSRHAVRAGPAAQRGAARRRCSHGTDPR